jgi:hypothetical protein
MMGQPTEVQTFAGDGYYQGIGRTFPNDWTDEQVQEWNTANCDCPFHASQREKEK